HAVDIIIHCGFARTMEGSDISNSLEFSNNLFYLGSINNCDIVNISSRSIYGQNPNIPWVENTNPSPNNLYSLGKISSELLLKKYKNNMIKVTNLRLAGLVSPVFNDRIVNKLIDKVINKEEIEIVGGKQQFPLMDLRDAASAIRSLIDSDI